MKNNLIYCEFITESELAIIVFLLKLNWGDFFFSISLEGTAIELGLLAIRIFLTK